MLLRLLSGVLIGMALAFAVTFLFCGWLTPFGTYCGHNSPILLLMFWIAGTLLAWIVLFGGPLWKRLLDGETDYHC